MYYEAIKLAYRSVSRLLHRPEIIHADNPDYNLDHPWAPHAPRGPVAKRLKSDADEQKLDDDGLSCLIKMRNEIVHPSRNKRLKWRCEEWIEAHELAAHSLELVLLAYVGCRGKCHPRTALNRHAGYVEDVPWLGC